MKSFAIQLVNRDGSVDQYDLGSATDLDSALAVAREYVLVSQSAVAAELFEAGILKGRVGRFDGWLSAA